MKATLQILLRAALLACADLQLHAQGTAFIYQGRLNNGGAVANGNYDFTFTLYATNTSGSALAGPVTNAATALSNGLFTTAIDFGGGFDGNARWLELAVRTNGGGSFTTLAPRQPLTPSPYAVFANTASNLLGSVATAQLTGTIPPTKLPGAVVTNLETGVTLGGSFAGNGGSLSNLNASLLASGTVPTNVLAGFQSPLYAAVGGGQNNSANNTYAVVSGGADNSAGYMSAVGGGYVNTASGFYAAIPGGDNNVASGQYSFAAGQNAQALHPGAFVWADSQPGAFASAGSDSFNVRAQGGVNFQTGTNPLTANGQPLLLNKAGNSAGAVVVGTGDTLAAGSTGAFVTGTSNAMPTASPYSALSGGLDNSILAPAQSANIGGGFSNSIAGVDSAIGGGQQNCINTGSGYGFVGGGLDNSLGPNVQFAAIGGGVYNIIQSSAGAGFIGGGQNNSVQSNATWSAIAGGYNNSIGIGVMNSFIGGGWNNAIQSGATNATIAGGSRGVIFSSSPSAAIGGGQGNNIFYGPAGAIAGGSNNLVEAAGGFIGGGWDNQAGLFTGIGLAAAVAGGAFNYVDGNYATIGGGSSNNAAGNYSAVSGGANNVVTGDYSTVGGGAGNTVSGYDSAIGAGNGNMVTGNNSAVAGGTSNSAAGGDAFVAGGMRNQADGSYSFASGSRAKAIMNGSWVWSDLQNADFSSSETNQFLLHAANGVGINTNHPWAALHVVNTDGTNMWRHYGGYNGDHAPPCMVLDQEAGDTGLNLLMGTDIEFADHGRVQGSIETQGNLREMDLSVNDPGVDDETGLTTMVKIGLTNVAIGGPLQVDGIVNAYDFNSTSDRNAKTNFTAINRQKILQKVVDLPITTWNFKSDKSQQLHLGPMAQDFFEAFDLGEDDRHIADVDEGGVALAAIQGLNQKLNDKDAEIQKLKARLERLEQLMAEKLGGAK